MGAVVSDQTAYRFRDDDGGEAAASWKDALNTDVSINVDETFRLRIQVSETAGGNWANVLFKLQSNTEGAGWQDVTAASTNVKSIGSANTTWVLTDDDPTTEQLAGAGTFTTGRWDDDGVTETAITLDADINDDTELEFCLQGISGDLDNGDVTTFRVVESDGTPFDNYTAGYPQVTWVEAAAPVTVNMGAAASTSAAPSTTVTPGAVSVTMAAAASTSVAPDLTASITTEITMAAAAMTSAAPSLTVTPGAASVSMNAAAATAAAPNTTPTPGAVSVIMAAAATTSDAPNLTTVPGAVTVSMGAAAGTSQAPALTVSPGGVTVTMAAAVATGNAPSVTVTPGAVVITMAAAFVTSDAPDVTPGVAGGGVVVSLSAVGLVAAAATLSVMVGARATGAADGVYRVVNPANKREQRGRHQRPYAVWNR